MLASGAPWGACFRIGLEVAHAPANLLYSGPNGVERDSISAAVRGVGAK